MQHSHSDQVMVVVLRDLVQQSIPRIISIRHKLKQGEVLVGSEVDFFLHLLHRLSHCYQNYAHDRECVTIFSCIAHMLYKVINLAHENEQKASARTS